MTKETARLMDLELGRELDHVIDHAVVANRLDGMLKLLRDAEKNVEHLINAGRGF